MHVIIGFLSSVVALLWILYRLAEMGIDLGGLNPFLWHRRRKWKKNYEANPVYQVDNPMAMTALLMTATAKADGDLSTEEKREILNMFQDEFHLSKRDAAGLLIASSHLLGKGDEVRENLPKVIAPSLERFSDSQAESALELVRRVATIGNEPSELQAELIDNAAGAFGQRLAPKGKWD